MYSSENVQLGLYIFYIYVYIYFIYMLWFCLLQPRRGKVGPCFLVNFPGAGQFIFVWLQFFITKIILQVVSHWVKYVKHCRLGWGDFEQKCYTFYGLPKFYWTSIPNFQFEMQLWLGAGPLKMITVTLKWAFIYLFIYHFIRQAKCVP